MGDVGPILIMVFLFAGVLLIVAVICTAGSSVKPPRAYGYHVDLADLARQAGDIPREQEELNKALESLAAVNVTAERKRELDKLIKELMYREV